MEIEKIISAGGSINLKEQADLRIELIKTSKKIRSELGEKSHLFDEFFLGVLTALDKMAVLEAVDAGFGNASEELRNLIICIREGNDKAVSHPFYPVLKEYIEKHPCPADGIYIDYYCACLIIEYSEFALNQYMKTRESYIRAVMDEAKIDTLKARLMETINPDDLERLYELIYSRFLLASLSKIFLQCMSDQYILNCLMQDVNGRYVFQYIMDGENE